MIESDQGLKEKRFILSDYDNRPALTVIHRYGQPPERFYAEWVDEEIQDGDKVERELIEIEKRRQNGQEDDDYWSDGSNRD